MIQLVPEEVELNEGHPVVLKSDWDAVASIFGSHEDLENSFGSNVRFDFNVDTESFMVEAGLAHTVRVWQVVKLLRTVEGIAADIDEEVVEVSDKVIDLDAVDLDASECEGFSGVWLKRVNCKR